MVGKRVPIENRENQNGPEQKTFMNKKSKINSNSIPKIQNKLKYKPQSSEKIPHRQTNKTISPKKEALYRKRLAKELGKSQNSHIKKRKGYACVTDTYNNTPKTDNPQTENKLPEIQANVPTKNNHMSNTNKNTKNENPTKILELNSMTNNPIVDKSKQSKITRTKTKIKTSTKPIKTEHFDITQINLQHSNAASLILASNLEILQDEHTSHAVCIQEPLCNKKHSIMDIPTNYTAHHKICAKNNPRAAILISNNINQNILYHDNLSDRDTCTISHRDPNDINKRTYICSAYMPYEEEIVNSKLIEVLKHTENTEQGLLICADTNSRSQAWGNKITNKRGIDLQEILDEYGLKIENQTHNPTWEARGSKTTIDLTISNVFAPSVHKWEILPNASYSDHHYIQFQCKNTGFKESKLTKYNLKKMNVKKYNDSLKEQLTNMTKFSYKKRAKLEYGATRLVNIMQLSIKNSCPRINTKTKKPGKNTKINRITSNLCLLIKQKQEGSPRKRKIKMARMIKQAKETEWKIEMGKIETLKETARLTKLLNKTKTSPLGALQKDDGSYTESPKETLERLADVHIGEAETRNVNLTPQLPVDKSQNEEDIEKYINKERIRLAVDNLKTGKSAGPDRIANEAIKQGIENIEEELQKIFVACIYHEHTPKIWQKANSAIIAKPGKSDYSQPKSYRIISLSSALLKLLETLILWHLQEDLKVEQSMNPNQYGFKSGHSTEAVLAKVINKIQNSKKQGGHTIGVFLDIQGAFDNLPHTAIQRALEKAIGKGKTSNWITNMVKSRDITLQHGLEQITRTAPKGCPQGGVLSPFLWNLVVDSLLKKFKNYKNIIAYADDLLLLQTGRDMKVTIEQAEHHIKQITNWCNENGLTISEVKTQVICWTDRAKDRPEHIKINDKKIQLVTHTKYLGLVIDEKLSWDQHIENLTTTCKNMIFSCRAAIGKKWGLNPKKVSWIYQKIIEPKLTYGAVVWAYGINKSNLKKLQTIQNIALRQSTRAQASTPGILMCTITNTTPIELSSKTKCLTRAISLMTEGHWDQIEYSIRKTKYKTHMEIVEGELKRILKDNFTNQTDKCRPVLNIDKTYKIKISSRKDFKVSTNSNKIKIYTDGSKNEKNHTGYGLYINDSLNDNYYEEKGPLHNHNSVYQAEAHAITQSAKLMINKEITNRDIEIYSDSQAVLKSLQKTKIKSRCIKDCSDTLKNLVNKQNTITLKWIPGHRGFEGNERADKLAKEGSQQREDTKPDIKHPHQSLRYIILKEQALSITLKLKNTQINEQNFHIIQTLLEKSKWNIQNITKTTQNLNTTDMAIFIRIISSHNNLNKRLHSQGLTISPKCDLCREQLDDPLEDSNLPEETTLHILEDCQILAAQRMKIFGEPKIEYALNINENKTSINRDIRNLITFFHSTRILSKKRMFNKPISPRRNIRGFNKKVLKTLSQRTN